MPSVLGVGEKSSPPPEIVCPCVTGAAKAARAAADKSPPASTLRASVELLGSVCGDVLSLWPELGVLEPGVGTHTEGPGAKRARTRLRLTVRLDRALKRTADIEHFLLTRTDPPRLGRNVPTADSQLLDVESSLHIVVRLWTTDPLRGSSPPVRVLLSEGGDGRTLAVYIRYCGRVVCSHEDMVSFEKRQKAFQGEKHR